ncbi:hypothetical protein HN011_002284 [Eciton burchellii]|nr:hypothetical protein HN011_002284 [Eciton burchellii]
MHNKPIAYNVATSIPGSDWPIQSIQFIKRPYILSTLPMQYRYFGLHPQYNSYYNPLINTPFNILHPLDGYILQPVSYLQSTSNQLISASGPTLNNANSEQRNDVTSDKTVNADDKTKELNVITNIISKEKIKTGNNEGNKS